MLDYSHTRDRLIHMIDVVFRNVVLGDGVSLHETVVIDDYGSDERRQEARLPDEKLDWRKLIDDPELSNICGIGGLCFYDAAGLRFHLPAYMTMILKDPVEQSRNDIWGSLEFNLTHLSGFQRERFEILTPYQRQTVREFLFFLRSWSFLAWGKECEAIDRALTEFWVDQNVYGSH